MSQQLWTVGETKAVTLGFGFSILNRYRAPVVTFSYETEEEAKAAEHLVRKALEGVLEVFPARMN